MGLENKVKSALKWSVAGKLVTQVINWVITIFVMGLLTPDDYGLMASAMFLIGMLLLFHSFGLDTVLIQKKELTDELLSSAFGAILLFCGFLSLCVVLTAPLVADYFGDDRIILILRVLSVQLVITAFATVPRVLVVRKLDAKKRELIFFLRNVSIGACSIMMALNGYGVWSLVFANTLGLVVMAFLFQIWSPRKIWPSFNLKPLKDIYSFGIYVIFQEILIYIYQTVDVLILGRFVSMNVLGAFTAASQLASLPEQKFAMIVKEIVLSGFSKIKDQTELVRQSISKAIRILSISIFPVYFGISSVAPEIVTTLWQDKWAIMILPLQLLTLVFPLRILHSPINELLNALALPKIYLESLAILCVLLIISILIGANWGMIGVCYAWLIGYPIAFFITLSRSGKYTGITPLVFIKSIYRSLFVSILMYGSVYLARLEIGEYGFESYQSLAILVMVGIISYTIFSILFNRPAIREVLSFVR